MNVEIIEIFKIFYVAVAVATSIGLCISHKDQISFPSHFVYIATGALWVLYFPCVGAQLMNLAGRGNTEQEAKTRE